MLKLRSRATNTRGVTLVEILLVVAIIALLAAILMPIFTSSKDQSARIKCALNLAQLGKAFQTYLSDWNGIYPSPGGVQGDFNYWSQSGNGGLVSYVRSKGGIGSIWCCPVAHHWKGKYAARTYSMNSYLRNPPDYEKAKALTIFNGCPDSIVTLPRRTILLYEGIPVTPEWNYSDDYIYRCGNWTCVRGYYWRYPYVKTIDSGIPWHGNTNNYLYCDGHVKCHPPFREPFALPIVIPKEIMNEWYVQKK